MKVQILYRRPRCFGKSMVFFRREFDAKDKSFDRHHHHNEIFSFRIFVETKKPPSLAVFPARPEGLEPPAF